MGSASSRGKRNRQRGHAFERQIAKDFAAIFGDSKRGLGQSRGADAADVEGTGPFWVEVKNVVGLSTLRPSLAQAGADAAHPTRRTEEKIPLVVYRDRIPNRKSPIYVVMRESAWVAAEVWLRDRGVVLDEQTHIFPAHWEVKGYRTGTGTARVKPALTEVKKSVDSGECGADSWRVKVTDATGEPFVLCDYASFMKFLGQAVQGE